MVLVGLGNNERKYAKTRHNVGFRVIDEITEDLKLSWQNHKAYETANGKIGMMPVLLVKPRSLMNNSGLAVKELIQQQNLKPESITLIYDDLNVPLGTVRIRSEGSHGGHNGVRSVIDQLGTGQFWRCRVGIGPAGHTDIGRIELDSSDYTDFVLSKFSTGEEHKLKEVIDLVTQRMLAFISHPDQIKEETFSTS